MFARITTVAFEGSEARAVDVQVQVGPGLPAFTIVGLRRQFQAARAVSKIVSQTIWPVAKRHH